MTARNTIAALLMLAAGPAIVLAQTPKPAEPTVAERNRAVLSELPFADRQDYDDAMRGFVATVPDARNPQQYQFLGLLLLDRGVLRAHQKVVTAQGAGEITSGTFSPTMQQSIALARLPLGVAIGDTVKVEIRDKQLDAKVVKPVFARNGKVVA